MALLPEWAVWSKMKPKGARSLKKIRHARALVASVINDIEADRLELDKAKVLIYAANILGQLIRDADTEAEFESMRKELAELKARIGLKVA